MLDGRVFYWNFEKTSRSGPLDQTGSRLSMQKKEPVLKVSQGGQFLWDLHAPFYASLTSYY
jgi:hypothetical protein